MDEKEESKTCGNCLFAKDQENTVFAKCARKGYVEKWDTCKDWTPAKMRNGNRVTMTASGGRL